MNFDNLKPEVTASEENSSRDEKLKNLCHLIV
jgi:hypothetical protein